jgi:pimeloyl-ACP methyl ester carboxylesterase
VIVPYLRGYGTTHFLSNETFRNGQPSVFALDIIALMDALNIQKAVLAGFDWGTRTADIIAALWPQRSKALVYVSGYGVGSQTSAPLPPEGEQKWWYQFYFATDQGKNGYHKYRHDFAKLIWQLASPKWNFDDATFERSAIAFNNTDHVDVMIHNYRWRQGLAKGEAKYRAASVTTCLRRPRKPLRRPYSMSVRLAQTAMTLERIYYLSQSGPETKNIARRASSVELVSNGKDEDDVFGGKPPTLRDVAVPAA